MRGEWTGAKRIVVKIGSSLLVDAAAGTLRQAWLEALADDIAALRQAGKEVVVVSSGAIALGRNALKLPKGALKLEDSQAAAAVGQIDLAHAYEEAFRARSLVAAQVLLTLGDTEQRQRYLNARNTMTTLLKLGAVPVVNENDTVATSEIRYGDNDRLAARVASMMSADCLVLLSDVDGFYTAPPGSRVDARRLEEVAEITPEIEAMAGDVGSELSKGGMVTKIEAAKIAASGGTHMTCCRRRSWPLRAGFSGRHKSRPTAHPAGSAANPNHRNRGRRGRCRRKRCVRWAEPFRSGPAPTPGQSTAPPLHRPPSPPARGTDAASAWWYCHRP